MSTSLDCHDGRHLSCDHCCCECHDPAITIDLEPNMAGIITGILAVLAWVFALTCAIVGITLGGVL